MNIKTKLNIGDEAWIIRKSKAVSFIIGYIIFDGAVSYGETRYDSVPESECFPTKEALLEYVAAE